MVHLAYGGHFLQKAAVTSQSIVLLRENARHHALNQTAVYGCTSDTLWISPNLGLCVLSPTESLRSTWLASDCNRCWCEASCHLLATDTRQQCLYPWYHCGGNAEMVVVTTLRSDVYHLLHMCHVLIKVTTFWRVFVILFFESSLYIHCSLSRWVHKYCVFWMVGFLCHLLIICTVNY